MGYVLMEYLLSILVLTCTILGQKRVVNGANENALAITLVLILITFFKSLSHS